MPRRPYPRAAAPPSSDRAVCLHMRCQDCKGSGFYVGIFTFSWREECTRCGGLGAEPPTVQPPLEGGYATWQDDSVWPLPSGCEWEGHSYYGWVVMRHGSSLAWVHDGRRCGSAWKNMPSAECDWFEAIITSRNNATPTWYAVQQFGP